MTCGCMAKITMGISNPRLRIISYSLDLQEHSHFIRLESAKSYRGHNANQNSFSPRHCRNEATPSENPRAIYSLIEAAVLPLSDLEDALSCLDRYGDSSPFSPKAMLAKDDEARKLEGALGSVVVMSMELPKGDNRSPQDALKKVRRRLSVSLILT
jgi:hypothetical protein